MPSQPDLPHVTRENLEEWGFKPNSETINNQMVYMMDDNLWAGYVKRYATFARRMDGPFAVLLNGKWVHTEDGYLAIDARGFPFPIDALEFSLNYQPVNPEGTHDSEEDTSEEEGPGQEEGGG